MVGRSKAAAKDVFVRMEAARRCVALPARSATWLAYRRLLVARDSRRRCTLLRGLLRAGRRSRGLGVPCLVQHTLLFSLFPLDLQALEGAQPLGQGIFVGCTKTKILVFRDDLEAVLLALGWRVDVDSVNNVSKRDDHVGRVFFLILVDAKGLGSKHHPYLFPLSHSALGLEHVEPAMVDDAFVARHGANVALLAKVLAFLRRG